MYHRRGCHRRSLCHPFGQLTQTEEKNVVLRSIQLDFKSLLRKLLLRMVAVVNPGAHTNQNTT